MTDDERRMEDMMLGKHLGKDKGTIKFMQKYYHKGAFYMVSKSVASRNSSTSDYCKALGAFFGYRLLEIISEFFW